MIDIPKDFKLNKLAKHEDMIWCFPRKSLIYLLIVCTKMYFLKNHMISVNFKTRDFIEKALLLSLLLSIT